MIKFIEKKRWTILNENIKRDEEGDFTYTGGRGETMIDYVIDKGKVREKMNE